MFIYFRIQLIQFYIVVTIQLSVELGYIREHKDTDLLVGNRLFGATREHLEYLKEMFSSKARIQY